MPGTKPTGENNPVHCLKKLRNMLTHKECLKKQNYNAKAYEERVVKFIKQAFPELLSLM
jgi:hypothetical protein